MPTKQNPHNKDKIVNMTQKYSFIEDNTARKTTFTKRKQGVMKKLTELMTLCDVKACAVIYSPYKPDPEVWPSREGVEEVVSEFLEVSKEDRAKKMVNQEAFLREMIDKNNAQLQKMRAENRNSEIQNTMFGCLNGEIGVHNLAAKDVQDLNSFIDEYLLQLTSRSENLKKNGVAVPVGYYDQIPDQNNQKMIQLQNDFLIEFCGQIPQKIQDFNKNVNLNSKKNIVLDLNQIPPVEEDGNIPSMDGSNHQP